MFSTEPPSVRQLSSSPRANEETANLRFATMAFSSSSFRSFFAAWDTNALGEVLQLVEIPIAVLEVAPVLIGERTLAMLRQLTSFGDEVREDEPLPFVESRETPLNDHRREPRKPTSLGTSSVPAMPLTLRADLAGLFQSIHMSSAVDSRWR